MKSVSRTLKRKYTPIWLPSVLKGNDAENALCKAKDELIIDNEEFGEVRKECAFRSEQLICDWGPLSMSGPSLRCSSFFLPSRPNDHGTRCHQP